MGVVSVHTSDCYNIKKSNGHNNNTLEEMSHPTFKNSLVEANEEYAGVKVEQVQAQEYQLKMS